jgi:hypothetical protein
MLKRKPIVILCISIVVGALASRPSVTGAKDEKLKPEDVVAKHLLSIGPAEKRNAIKTRVTVGPVQVNLRQGGFANTTGKGNLISDGKSVRLAFNFPSVDYRGEQIAYDGNKVTVMQINPGNYSPLAGFIYEDNYPVKEGLMMGVLSTGWALQDIATRQPKLEYNGIKKVNGRQVHELKYLPKNSKATLQTSLYFDADTFRHVGTMFKLERPPARIVNITDSAELVHYEIVERFDNFKEVDGLTLPHSYYLEFSVNAPTGASLTTFTHTIEQILHNTPVERAVFTTN